MCSRFVVACVFYSVLLVQNAGEFESRVRFCHVFFFDDGASMLYRVVGPTLVTG